MIGTSDQSCWLAEACKNPSLEGLWMYGVTVYLDRHQVQMWLPWSHLEVLDTGNFKLYMELFCLCGSDTAEKEHRSFSSKTNDHGQPNNPSLINE